jgi:putative endonuclease
MYFVYVLKNERNNELYYGYTNNIERRSKEHGNADNKWKLIYYEAYGSKLDARERERKLKNYGQSRSHIKNRIKRSLQL